MLKRAGAERVAAKVRSRMGTKTEGKNSGGLRVVTANRLTDGVIVWLDARNSWVEEVAEAAIVEGEALETALQFAAAEEKRRIVVGAYPVIVTRSSEGPLPMSVRERIRAVGPTVRLDLARRGPLPELSKQAAR
jgi:sulfite reductase (NADPH) hemoprotein beta-component